VGFSNALLRRTPRNASVACKVHAAFHLTRERYVFLECTASQSSSGLILNVLRFAGKVIRALTAVCAVVAG
jgi:hypothetical protein